MGRVFRRIIPVLLCVCMLVGLIHLVPSLHIHTHAEEAAQSEISIQIIGGTATFVSNSAAFSGTCGKGDVLSVRLTPQPGREFKCWKTMKGSRIPDADFKLIAGEDDVIYAVFTDTEDYPFTEWVLVSRGNCEEGDLYRRENTQGDVEYKKEFPNGNYHEYGDCIYVDEEHHKYVCSKCGYEEIGSHNYGDVHVIEEATHSEEGLQAKTCYGCDHSITTAIPKTDRHVFDGKWTIIRPARGNTPGIRSRKCLYCDETETYWYLDYDLKSIMQNHFIEYTDSYGGLDTHLERYYHYVNDEGLDVYVMALQYQYAYSGGTRDGNTSWVWTYVDDGNSETLDPVYLSKSYGDSMGAYVNAFYGYAYDFYGYLQAVRSPDFAIPGMTGMGFGNTMSARASAFLAWTNDWVEEFNARMFPTSIQDPMAEFISSDPEAFKRWIVEYEHDKAAYRSVWLGKDPETNEDRYAQVGGFQNCTTYKKWVSGDENNKLFDYITIDNETGLNVSFSTWTTAQRTSQYVSAYKEILSAEDYNQIDESLRSGYFNVEDIETDVKNFCGSHARNAFPTFTLDLPTERQNAVRMLVEGAYVYVEANNQKTNVMYNNGKVFYVPQNSNYPDSNRISLKFDADSNPSLIFDRWEKWNVERGEWVLYSTNPQITFNTYSNPLSEPTFLRVVSHVTSVTKHLSITGGTIYCDGKSVTEGDFPVGTQVSLYSNYQDHMEIEGIYDSQGNLVENTRFAVTQDEAFTVRYTPSPVRFNLQVFRDGDGNVWTQGREEEKGLYHDVSLMVGESVTLCTEGTEPYDTFCGWYLQEYGKTGERYTLLSKDTTFTLAADSYALDSKTIVAVWVEDAEDFDPDGPSLTIRVPSAGFLYAEGEEYDPRPPFDENGSFNHNAFSSLTATPYSTIMLIDDPTDEIRVGKWIASWTDPESQPATDEISVDFAYGDPSMYWLSDQMQYPEGLITIEAVPVEPCAPEEHDWDEGHYSVYPGHTTPGETVYTCYLCGEQKVETAPPEGHSTVFHAGTDPDCTHPGSTSYYTCSGCELWFADENGSEIIEDHASVTIPALGHSWGEWVVDQDATEEAAGLKHRECTRCHKYDSAEIPVLVHNHQIISVAKVEPTCVDTGTQAHYRCELCGKLFTTETADEEIGDPSSLTIPAKGHTPGDPVRENEVPATCSKAGSYDEVVYCTVCHEELSRTPQVIPTLNHIPENEPRIENRIEPTCEAAGSYDSVIYCADCQAELSRRPVTVPANGHSYGPWIEDVPASEDTDGQEHHECSVCHKQETRTIPRLSHQHQLTLVEGSEPTCLKEGHAAYLYCESCGKKFSVADPTAEMEDQDLVIPATGHVPGQAVRENVTEATCTKNGSYDEVVYCTICKEELSRQTHIIEASGHTVPPAGVRENVKAPTCVTDGSYDEVLYCPVCHEELSRTSHMIQAEGHKAGDPVRENISEPSCTAAGSYDEVVYCTVCHEEISRRTVTLDPTAHVKPESSVRENEKAATCDEVGSYDEVVYCAVCHAEMSRTTQIVEKTGHTYGEWVIVKEPTAYEEGLAQRTCTHDPSHIETRVLPAILPDESDSTAPLPEIYEITSGADITYDPANGSSLEIVSNASFNKFVGVRLDDHDVPEDCYTAVEGSTRITFKAEYLKELPAGKHTIDVVSTDGIARTELTVSGETARKGCGSLVGTASTWLVVSIICLVGFGMTRKKEYVSQ